MESKVKGREGEKALTLLETTMTGTDGLSFTRKISW
jgi:hypothetical protein